MTLKKKKMKKTTTLNLFTVKLFIIIEFIYSSKRISESIINVDDTKIHSDEREDMLDDSVGDS